MFSLLLHMFLLMICKLIAQRWKGCVLICLLLTPRWFLYCDILSANWGSVFLCIHASGLQFYVCVCCCTGVQLKKKHVCALSIFMSLLLFAYLCLYSCLLFLTYNYICLQDRWFFNFECSVVGGEVDLDFAICDVQLSVSAVSTF